MKRQADRVNPARVRLHIQRQRALGERMVGEQDYSSWPELLTTTVMILAMLIYSAYRGWI